MIRNRIFRITFSFLIITALFLSAVITADAAGDAKYTDPDTNYRVVIIDDDDLLTDAEESHLVDYMKPITASTTAKYRNPSMIHLLAQSPTMQAAMRPREITTNVPH